MTCLDLVIMTASMSLVSLLSMPQAVVDHQEVELLLVLSSLSMLPLAISEQLSLISTCPVSV